MTGLLTITRLTLHEAARKRVLLAALLLGLAFVTLYAVGFHFIARNLLRFRHLLIAFPDCVTW